MAKEFTDIKDLLKKVDNEEAREEIESSAVPTEEYLSAKEFVKGVIEPIIELQQDAKTNVKAVRFNNVTYEPDAEGTVIFNQMVDQDTYTVRFAVDTTTDKTYVLKTGAPLNIGLRYMALRITTAGDRINYQSVPGTLVISRSTNGRDYTDVYTDNNVQSVNENSTAFPVSLNLGQYCVTGQQTIRIRVSTYYFDENNVRHDIQNEVIYTINAVNLVVKNMASWEQPILASNGAFPLSFAFNGAVEKWLHVQVSGATGTFSSVQKFGADVQRPESNPYTWSEREQAAIGILTHGVHTVTAWLSCDDGSGQVGADGYPNGLESERVVNRFMVVNTTTAGADLQKPYLMLQQVVANAENFVRTTLCSYAVWIPSKDNPEIASTDSMVMSIRLTDSADNDTDYTQEYFRSEVQVVSSTQYVLDTTVEIESTTDGANPPTYDAYLRIFRYAENGDVINFMRESTNIRYAVITVDNSNDFSPVAGAHFFLNPKVRNNSEANWQTIINQMSGDPVPSTWQGYGGVNDAWVEDDNKQKVLRTLAGQSLNIDYEPWEQFKTNASAQMSLEINFAVRNITNEDDPILDICQTIGQAGQLLGLRMKPLTAFLMAQQRQAENDQDWGFQEGERTHCAIVLNPSVIAKASDELTWQNQDGEMKPLSLAKIYINGFINRELDYPLTAGAWIQEEGHGGIKIGCAHADIDLYGLRCYRGIALSAQNVLQNYIASLPTAEEKLAVRHANDILDGNGRVSYDKVKAHGKRCLTLFGQDNYKLNQDKDNGYPCYWRIDYFDDKGVYVPELSGTIAKAAYEASVAGTLGGKKCLLNTAQGSTANTYWDNNEQTKCDKVTYVINIPFNTLHADFGWKASKSVPDSDGKIANQMYLDGNPITPTDYADLTSEQQSRVMIDVLDGWIDGNGMYHGQGYTSAIGAALAAKLVNKINYASPMQSHKMGATRLYNDVMMAVTGGMALHAQDPKARFAVLEDSFFFFTAHPDDDFKVEFRGMGTFGSGKCDKPTWGYNTNKAAFVFEGANNNLPLCDFRVPADDDVVYVPSGEAWYYNGVKSFDYDMGKTKVVVEDGEEVEYPIDANDRIFRRYANFIYTHGVSLELYRGTRAQFNAEYAALLEKTNPESPDYDPTASETIADMQTKKYWFRDGTEQFHLVRYNFVTSEWVDAGVFDASEDSLYKSGVCNLSTDDVTKTAYEDWLTSEDYGDYVNLNKRFIYAIAQNASDNFSLVGHVKSHRTHYNLVNFFLAGTDNCSKNTYYHVDPNTGLVWLDQDDLDTIFKTDNNGRQTKVYFLDRIHDMEDYIKGYKLQADYEGRASNLFNLIEVMWETLSEDLRQNMRECLTAMASLVSPNDTIEGVGEKVSVWGCLHKYFFSIQRYFPQVAYNEQARLRYEYPKSFGYISRGNQSRGIDPITQSVGNQLESEIQYMKRRLALVASYACWGDFSSGVNTGVVGLPDSGDSFSVSPGSGRTGGDYIFNVVPHQFLYPTGMADRAAVDPHVRVAPGESYRFVVATLGQISGDSSVGLAATNYYRSIGNVGNMVAGNNSLSIKASRLTEFIAEPVSGGASFFAPKVISFTGAPNIEHLSLRGCENIGVTTLDLSTQSRLQSLDLRGTGTETVITPQSSAFESMQLGAYMTSVNVHNLPRLSELTIENAEYLRTLRITETPLADSQDIVRKVVESGNKKVNFVNIDNINWQNVAPEVLEWLTGVPNTTMLGTMDVTQGQIVNAALKQALLIKFGPIDSESNPLYITYTVRNLTQVNILTQRFIIPTVGDYPYEASVLPTTANNFTDVTWALSKNSLGATVDAHTGVLHVPVLGTESSNPVVQLTCTVTLMNGSSMSATINIKLFNRLPKPGDFAYADGQFDNELYYGKDVVGWVYKVTEYSELPDYLRNFYFEEDPNRRTMYDAGTKLYEILVEYKENVSYKTKDAATTFSSTPWGIYPNASQGLSPAEIQAIADEVTAAGYAMTAAQVTDLSALPNYTTTGLRNSAGTAYNDSNIRDYNAYDNTKDDGFMTIADTAACGRWDGKHTTQLIVEHAKRILGNYAVNMKNAAGQTIWEVLGNPDHLIPENSTELADLLVALGNVGGRDQWRQIAYPAAFSCLLHEPEARELHPQYARGNWYLPDAGSKARLYIYFRNSRAIAPADSGTPTAAFSDIENPSRPREATEARRPHYANLLKFASDKDTNCPINMPSQSSPWTAIENSGLSAWGVNFGNGGAYAPGKFNSGVVRPVSAFCFEL